MENIISELKLKIPLTYGIMLKGTWSSGMIQSLGL
jgi:hypothetical protein